MVPKTTRDVFRVDSFIHILELSVREDGQQDLFISFSIDTYTHIYSLQKKKKDAILLKSIIDSLNGHSIIINYHLFCLLGPSCNNKALQPSEVGAVYCLHLTEGETET